jgi:hypothetical protein
VRLVGFIKIIYHDARFYECQNPNSEVAILFDFDMRRTFSHKVSDLCEI